MCPKLNGSVGWMAHGEEGNVRAVPLLNLKKAWVMKYQVCVRKTAVGVSVEDTRNRRMDFEHNDSCRHAF